MKIKKSLQLLAATAIITGTAATSAILLTSCSSNKLNYVDIIGVNDYHGAADLELKSTQGASAITVRNFIQLSYTLNHLRDINHELTGDKNNLEFVSLGDMYQEGAFSNLTYGKNIIDLFHSEGMKLSALGNHEFDWGEGFLNPKVKNDKLDEEGEPYETFADQGDFEFLACNIYSKETGKRADWCKPYKIKKYKGKKVAYIGYTTPTTPSATGPWVAKNYEFLDVNGIEGKPSLNETVLEAKNAGADAIVVMAHEGGTEFANKLSAMENIRKVDVVLTGHTHEQYSNFLEEAPANVSIMYGSRTPQYIISENDNEIPFIQGGAHGDDLQAVRLDFSNSENELEVKSLDNKPYGDFNILVGKKDENKNALAQLATPKEIEYYKSENKTFKKSCEILDKEIKESEKITGKVIGNVTHRYDPDADIQDNPLAYSRRIGNSAGLDLSAGSNGKPVYFNTQLGQLFGQIFTNEIVNGEGYIGDTMKKNDKNPDSASYSDLTIDNIDSYVQNCGGLRDDLNSGDFTINTLYKQYPFDNYLIIANIKVKDLKSIFDDLIAESNKARALMQYNNLKVKVQITGTSTSPTYQVTEIYKTIDSETPLNDEDVITIALTDFLFYGGDSVDKDTSPTFDKLVLCYKEYFDVLMRNVFENGIKVGINQDGSRGNVINGVGNIAYIPKADDTIIVDNTTSH